MPLKWAVSQPERLVTLQTEGIVHFSDVHTFLEAIRQSEAIAFRKLVDAREGSTEMSQADSMCFAGALNAFSSIEPLGPHAIVLGPRGTTGHSPLIMGLMMVKRPFRVFHDDMDHAREWITKQP